MNYKQLLILFVALALAACASTQTPPKKLSKEKPVQSSLALENMDVEFLYLAAQQALGQGQPALAKRFLSVLIKKKPEEIEPRLELADLYLASGQAKEVKEAKTLIESMSETSVARLKNESLERYQLLYARALAANGEAEQASSLLQLLLRKHPENIQIRLLLTRLSIMQGDLLQGQRLLKQGLAIKYDLRLQQAQVQLYLQQGYFKQADQTLAKIQKRYPEHEDAVLQRSQLAEQQGDVLKAEELLKLYIDLHSDVALESYVMLAGLYVRQERLEEAIVTYKSVLKLSGGSVDAYMALGKVYYQLTQYTKAVMMFEKAVQQFKPLSAHEKLTDMRATVFFYLGASLEASHEWKKAIPYYLKLNKGHALYLDAQLRLVNIDLANKQFDKAEKTLIKLRVSFANNINVYEMLSELRLKQKAYQSLIEETDKAIDMGFSSTLLFNRAIAFESLKQFKQLDASLDSLLNKIPEHPEALNFYGYSLADRGIRLDDAASMITQALKIRPNDGYYLDSLAWVYYKQKKYTKAMETQLRAVQLVASDPVMQEHLGDIYWQKGEAEQARKHWRKAIELKHKSAQMISQKIEHGLM